MFHTQIFLSFFFETNTRKNRWESEGRLSFIIGIDYLNFFEWGIGKSGEIRFELEKNIVFLFNFINSSGSRKSRKTQLLLLLFVFRQIEFCDLIKAKVALSSRIRMWPRKEEWKFFAIVLGSYAASEIFHHFQSNAKTTHKKTANFRLARNFSSLNPRFSLPPSNLWRSFSAIFHYSNSSSKNSALQHSVEALNNKCTGIHYCIFFLVLQTSFHSRTHWISSSFYPLNFTSFRTIFPTNFQGFSIHRVNTLPSSKTSSQFFIIFPSRNFVPIDNLPFYDSFFYQSIFFGKTFILKFQNEKPSLERQFPHDSIRFHVVSTLRTRYFTIKFKLV